MHLVVPRNTGTAITRFSRIVHAFGFAERFEARLDRQRKMKKQTTDTLGTSQTGIDVSVRRAVRPASA